MAVGRGEVEVACTRIALACAALVGCTKPAPRVDDALTRAALGTYAEIAYASYADALAGARTLAATVEALVQAPSPASLARAQGAWLEARKPYAQSEVFRFADGPIDALELLVNTWPIDESYVDAAEPGARGVIQDAQRHPSLSAALLRTLNVSEGETSVSTGYHVIEYLLWGRDTRADGPGARTFAAFVPSEGEPDAGRRAEYLRLASGLLVEHLEEVTRAWAPGTPDNYRARFGALAPREGLALALRSLGKLAGGELAGERLTVAYETKDQENEHSCFSDSTTADLAGDAQGMVNVCKGSYLRGDGTALKGTGLCAALQALDPGLGAALAAQIDAAAAAVRAIPNPFDRAIQGGDGEPGRRAIAAAIRALESEAHTLSQLTAQLAAASAAGAP